MITLDPTADLALQLANIANVSPVHVSVPKGDYDMTGLEIPLNSHWVGAGYDNAGLGTVFKGSPVQATGPQGSNFFRGIVFDGGFTVRKQRTHFDDCLFKNGGLVFDQTGASPYHSSVSRSWFEDCPGAALRFIGQANSIAVRDCNIQVPQDARGIEILAGTNVVNVSGTALESSAAQIKSYVYCEGRSCSFRENYIDSNNPSTTDGAMWVFPGASRGNRVYHARTAPVETVLDHGVRNLFDAL